MQKGMAALTGLSPFPVRELRLVRPEQLLKGHYVPTPQSRPSSKVPTILGREVVHVGVIEAVTITLCMDGLRATAISTACS